MFFAGCAKSSVVRFRLGPNYEVSKHGRAVSRKAAQKLVTARRGSDETDLPRFSGAQQIGAGNNVGVTRLEPTVLRARSYTALGHSILGTRRNQHPVVLIDTLDVFENQDYLGSR